MVQRPEGDKQSTPSERDEYGEVTPYFSTGSEE